MTTKKAKYVVLTGYRNNPCIYHHDHAGLDSAREGYTRAQYQGYTDVRLCEIDARGERTVIEHWVSAGEGRYSGR